MLGKDKIISIGFGGYYTHDLGHEGTDSAELIFGVGTPGMV